MLFWLEALALFCRLVWAASAAPAARVNARAAARAARPERRMVLSSCVAGHPRPGGDIIRQGSKLGSRPPAHVDEYCAKSGALETILRIGLWDIDFTALASGRPGSATGRFPPASSPVRRSRR